jgi:hypothetical protein
VRVDGDLNVTSHIVAGDAPAHPLRLADLAPRAAAAQTGV